jgi:hypothetical protein
MDFYTYIYYDPSRNHEPFYVGKGHGERAWCHLTKRQPGKSGRLTPFYARLNTMLAAGIQPAIGIYGDLDEELAHLVEEELIAKFGRRTEGTGPLWNLTKGGEGFRGVKHCEESKAKIKASCAANPKCRAWEGKTLSDEHKANISAANQGKEGPWRNKSLSAEHRTNIGAGLKGHVCSPETRAKIGAKIAAAAAARRSKNHD